MHTWFQRGVNVVVVFMFVTWWLIPTATSFLPYEDDILPDEVVALDTEIASYMETLQRMVFDATDAVSPPVTLNEDQPLAAMMQVFRYISLSTAFPRAKQCANPSTSGRPNIL